MDVFTHAGEAVGAIARFQAEHAASLSEDTRERLIELSATVSSVDSICGTAELLYARQAEVGAAGRRLAAQLALHAGGVNQWHNMRAGRGEKIAWAMMRRNGYSPPPGVTFQSAAEDPAPDERFIPAVEPEPDPA